MKTHGVTTALMGGICALALASAATPASAANAAFLAHNGSGSTCSLAAPCAAMFEAVAAAGR